MKANNTARVAIMMAMVCRPIKNIHIPMPYAPPHDSVEQIKKRNLKNRGKK